MKRRFKLPYECVHPPLPTHINIGARLGTCADVRGETSRSWAHETIVADDCPARGARKEGHQIVRV